MDVSKETTLMMRIVFTYSKMVQFLKDHAVRENLSVKEN
jgi:hypothetical protein